MYCHIDTTDYFKVNAMELFTQTVDIRRLFPTPRWPGIEPFLSSWGEPLAGHGSPWERARNMGFQGVSRHLCLQLSRA